MKISKLEEIKKQFEMVKNTETFVITTETVKWLIEQLEEKEEYRLEICRLYDKYCR